MFLANVSPKVIASTLGAVVASAVLAGLNYLITPEGQQLFASLPPVLVVSVVALITGLITAFTGWLKFDPARTPPPPTDGYQPKHADTDTPEGI